MGSSCELRTGPDPLFLSVLKDTDVRTDIKMSLEEEAALRKKEAEPKIDKDDDGELR